MLGLVVWIYLQALVVILAAEINVVRQHRLFPRSLRTPFTDDVELTGPDIRAYTSQQAASAPRGFERVEASFEPSAGSAENPPPEPVREAALRAGGTCHPLKRTEDVVVRPGSTESALWAAWQYARSAGRVTALTAYGLLAAVGAVSAPGPSLLSGALLAVTGWAVVVGLHRLPDLPPLPHPAVAGTRLACLPAAVAGTTASGVPAGVVVGLGLALATALLAHWATTLPSPGSAPAEPVGDEQSLRALLHGLPMDLLFDEWRSTQGQRSLGGATSTAARLRELLIDEMRRRNPTGTSRWLVDGFDEPPDGYVGGRSS